MNTKNFNKIPIDQRYRITDFLFIESTIQASNTKKISQRTSPIKTYRGNTLILISFECYNKFTKVTLVTFILRIAIRKHYIYIKAI